MKFISNEKSSFSIEITPLIDIVFLLVIFFVVTSKVGDSQFLSLDLPKTESFEYKTVQSKNEIVIISSGSIYVNNNVFDINDIDKLDQAIFELENARYSKTIRIKEGNTVPTHLNDSDR